MVDKRHGQSGFSLTEVVVAFAILAMSVTVLLQSFSLGQKKISHSELLLDAGYFAQSKLEEVGPSIELRRQEVVGVYEPYGFGWRVVIDPFDPELMQIIPQGEESKNRETRLYRAHVSVHEESSGRLLFEMSTVKFSGDPM